MLDDLILSHRSLRVCPFVFGLFSLCVLFGIVSVALSSSSLLFSSVVTCSTLLIHCVSLGPPRNRSQDGVKHC